MCLPADFVYKNSSLSLPLNDFTNGFSQGELGGMDAVTEPLPVHHSCKAWPMNSAPLAIRRWVGAGRRLPSRDADIQGAVAPCHPRQAGSVSACKAWAFADLPHARFVALACD